MRPCLLLRDEPDKETQWKSPRLLSRDTRQIYKECEKVTESSLPMPQNSPLLDSMPCTLITGEEMLEMANMAQWTLTDPLQHDFILLDSLCQESKSLLVHVIVLILHIEILHLPGPLARVQIVDYSRTTPLKLHIWHQNIMDSVKVGSVFHLSHLKWTKHSNKSFILSTTKQTQIIASSSIHVSPQVKRVFEWSLEAYPGLLSVSSIAGVQWTLTQMEQEQSLMSGHSLEAQDLSFTLNMICYLYGICLSASCLWSHILPTWHLHVGPNNWIVLGLDEAIQFDLLPLIHEIIVLQCVQMVSREKKWITAQYWRLALPLERVPFGMKHEYKMPEFHFPVSRLNEALFVGKIYVRCHATLQDKHRIERPKLVMQCFTCHSICFRHQGIYKCLKCSLNEQRIRVTHAPVALLLDGVLQAELFDGSALDDLFAPCSATYLLELSLEKDLPVEERCQWPDSVLNMWSNLLSNRIGRFLLSLQTPFNKFRVLECKMEL